MMHVSPEYKTADHNAVSNVDGLAGPGHGPLVQLLNDPGEGVNDQMRIGDKCKFVSCFIRCRILFGTSLPAGSTITTLYASSSVSVSLVLDKQPNNTLFTFSDLYNGNDPHTMTNLNYRDRFVILYEKLISTPPHATVNCTGLPSVISSCSGGEYIFKKYIPLDIDTVYTNTPVGIGSIRSNALFLVVRSSATNSFLPLVTTIACVSTRLRFIDI